MDDVGVTDGGVRVIWCGPCEQTMTYLGVTLVEGKGAAWAYGCGACKEVKVVYD